MPGQRHVGQVPVHGLRGQHESPVHRHTLCLVDRHRIAVIDRGTRIHVQKDRLPLPPGPHRDLSVLQPRHHPETAVAHPEAAVIDQEHHLVPHREGAMPHRRPDLLLHLAQQALLPQRAADHAVQRHHVAPPVGERQPALSRMRHHIHRVFRRQRQSRIAVVRAEPHPVARGIAGQALFDLPGGKMLRGLPLPVLALAVDGIETGGAAKLRHRPERCSRADRLQLVRIPDQHHLGPGRPDLLQNGRQLRRAQHARLVHHQHVLRPRYLLPALPAPGPGSKRSRLDPRGLLQPIRRLACQRRALHPVAIPLPGLPRGGQHGRFPGTRPARHHRDPLRPGHMPQRRLLLAGQRRGPQVAGLGPKADHVLHR